MSDNVNEDILMLWGDCDSWHHVIAIKLSLGMVLVGDLAGNLSDGETYVLMELLLQFCVKRNGTEGPDVDRAIYKKCDVTVEKQVEETVAFAIEKYGTLDIMYSNAGIMGPMDSVLDMDMEDSFDRTMAVNLRGPALCIKHAARAMVKRQVRGSIICTASTASVLGGMVPIAYNTSKHGLVGLVRAAASELGKHGIRVNCVSPYILATPLAISWTSAMGINNASGIEALASSMANLKGVALKAKHVAEAALFLASDESSVYVSGHNLVVDGGFTVVDNSITMLMETQIKQ
ncbi:hypothetical protein RHGRI_018078 [Rhododendron griersonianum]|uniref:Uncharacterized protein n=1 Tax=Rhododendron griersonianum TaxID=479676 RepID=A0AAV6K052_9ERIC|nr:hypothetical protein RHGRI_018078 [Rhododendron griersonianum]